MSKEVVLKKDIIEKVEKEFGISKNKANQIVTFVIETIANSLKKGKEVKLTNLGKFTIVEKPEMTKKIFGVVQTIPARKKVKFVPTKSLKNL